MEIGVVKHCYSKTAGVIAITPRLIVDAHDAEVIQLVMLRTHYRADLQFHKMQMEDSSRVLTTLYRVLRDVEPDGECLDWDESHAARFAVALNDDFNTPRAFAVLYALSNAVRATKSRVLARQLAHLGSILGILRQTPIRYLESQAKSAKKPSSVSVLQQMKIAPKMGAPIVHRSHRMS